MPITSINSFKQNAKVLGKYLDQTALVEKLYNTMPYVLTGAAVGYGMHDTFNKTPKEQRKKKAIKNASVLTFTVLSALIATRGLKIKGKQIFEGIIELPENDEDGISEILKKTLSPQAKEKIKKINERI